MQTNLILHNSISLDGSLTNFAVDMELHYRIAGEYKPDAHLIGSNTIQTGIKLYGSSKPERKNDFKKAHLQSNKLKEKIKNKNSFLYFFNLLRISFLQKKLKKEKEELLSLKELKTCITTNKNILSFLKDNNFSMKTYILAREKELNAKSF